MGAAAVKSEQAETRAQRRKHAKGHGMVRYMKGLRRGSSSGQRDGVVGRNGLISTRDVHHSSSVFTSFLVIEDVRPGFSSIRYGLRIGLVRKWKSSFPPEVSDPVG